MKYPALALLCVRVALILPMLAIPLFITPLSESLFTSSNNFGFVATKDFTDSNVDEEEAAYLRDFLSARQASEKAMRAQADETVPWMRAILLLVLGISQISAIRFCSQAFLDQAVVLWYEFRHNKHGKTQ